MIGNVPEEMVVELALLENGLVEVVGLGQRAREQQAPIILRQWLGIYRQEPCARCEVGANDMVILASRPDCRIVGLPVPWKTRRLLGNRCTNCSAPVMRSKSSCEARAAFMLEPMRAGASELAITSYGMVCASHTILRCFKMRAIAAWYAAGDIRIASLRSLPGESIDIVEAVLYGLGKQEAISVAQSAAGARTSIDWQHREERDWLRRQVQSQCLCVRVRVPSPYVNHHPCQ